MILLKRVRNWIYSVYPSRSYDFRLIRETNHTALNTPYHWWDEYDVPMVWANKPLYFGKELLDGMHMLTLPADRCNEVKMNEWLFYSYEIQRRVVMKGAQETLWKSCGYLMPNA